MGALTPADRVQLAKRLSILGSAHCGERDAAGLAAHRLVTARGATWAEVVAPTLAPPATQHREAKPAPPRPTAWRATAEGCLRAWGPLTRWEAEFLRSIWSLPSLSPKQHEVLAKIAGKVRAAGVDIP